MAGFFTVPSFHAFIVCLGDFEMVLVACIITGVTFAFNATYPEFLLLLSSSSSSSSLLLSDI